MSSIIEVRNLKYRYPGNGQNALKGLSFSIKRGEIFGFLGPSGAGKSTTQKVLIKLLSGFTGSCRILGRDIDSWSNDLYQRIGVAFEEPNLYEKFTANENLNYFSTFYEKNFLPRPWLAEKLSLNDAMDQTVSTYSKGMRTRLSLMRALIHDPEILFLDEPTTGLDPVNTSKVISLIQDMKNRGKTVFLTTHNMHVAGELCDRLGFMLEGSLSTTGSPRDLTIEYGSRNLTIEYLSDGITCSRGFPLDGLGSNSDFIKLLKATKTKDLLTIHSGEATLDDVFLKVTGERLRR